MRAPNYHTQLGPLDKGGIVKELVCWTFWRVILHFRMSWPKTGAPNYHTQLGPLDKAGIFKELVCRTFWCMGNLAFHNQHLV